MRFDRILLFLVLLLAAFGQDAPAAACPPPFAGLIQNGAYGVSDLEGKIVEGCNLDTAYVPASLLKVPTALAALSVLGPDYRFKTRFYADNQDNLYIQGFGDPLLTSEEIRFIFDELKQRGLRQVNAIYIDASNFALEYQTPGSEFSNNPYDAPVGAVSVNFNSVPIRLTKEGLVSSSEPQTPVLPLTKELAAGCRPGSFRINLCPDSNDHAEARMARYAAELFRALQQEAGIPGQGELGQKPAPNTARLLHEHRSSKNLLQLTSSFLKFSSNFIANLVYLAIGAEQFGWPATWGKADRAVQEELARQLGKQSAAAIVHRDGAGLYRGDRVTARAMLETLHAFRSYAGLMRKHLGVLGKSGSMKGIWNYAGYLTDGRPYVILLNQRANQRNAVLELLQEKFSGKKRTPPKALKKASKRSAKKKRKRRD